MKENATQQQQEILNTQSVERKREKSSLIELREK
jgi:hypothetical protein